MLSDKDCEELAGIFISMIQQMPDNLVNERMKFQIGASHSIITAGIISSKEEWEETLSRFLYWVNSKDIKEGVPPSD